MAGYHLYFLSGGQLLGSETIEAADDDAAAAAARTLGCGRGQFVEVWNGIGRVRIVRPDAPAPAAAQAAADQIPRNP